MANATQTLEAQNVQDSNPVWTLFKLNSNLLELGSNSIQNRYSNSIWTQFELKIDLYLNQIRTDLDSNSIFYWTWFKLNSDFRFGFELCRFEVRIRFELDFKFISNLIAERALRKCDREDIINKCIVNVELVTDESEKSAAKVALEIEETLSEREPSPFDQKQEYKDDEPMEHISDPIKSQWVKKKIFSFFFFPQKGPAEWKKKTFRKCWFSQKI